MFGKFTLALLVAASPALAADPATVDPNGATETAETAPAVEYKTKKICRAIEVVGSSIPRMACTTKRVPIKPAKDEAGANSSQSTQPEGARSE